MSPTACLDFYLEHLPHKFLTELEALKVRIDSAKTASHCFPSNWMKLLFRRMNEATLHHPANARRIPASYPRLPCLIPRLRKCRVLRQGRSDQGSSPCSMPPQSHARTPAASHCTHRLPRGLGAENWNRRRDQRQYPSTWVRP